MRLFLPEASSNATEVDLLFGALLLITVAVLALVFGLIWIYAIRYRATNPLDRGTLTKKSWRFEIAWTVATLVVFFGLFVWGADLYVRMFQPPEDALKIYVSGKQWMWKVQHQSGQREINALHVPVDVSVQLVMTSEDVIHDFSVPAFRIKHDVLPGRYESLWFRADRPGTYHLFCTQFCGTDHAAMGGEVDVLSRTEFDGWLADNGAAEPLAAQGRTLFAKYGCGGCHGGGSTVRAPLLDGLYGSAVALRDGRTVVADEDYLRRAILTPGAQVVAGFEPLMPAFAGVMAEDDVFRLIAFIKSLAAKQG